MTELGAVVVGAALGLCARLVWPRRRVPGAAAPRMRPDHVADEVAAALDSLAMCLRAGLTPAAALRVAAGRLLEGSPVRAALREVARAVARGEPASTVWDRHTRAVEPLRQVAGAWVLTERTGTALEPALSWAAAQLRERRAAAERLNATTAGARASMAILLLLPLSGPAFGLFVGLSPMQLYGSLGAALACIVGMGCAVAGWFASRRILARALLPGTLDDDPPHPVSTIDDLADATVMLWLVLASGSAVIESLETVAEVSRGRVRADLTRVAAAYRWGRSHGEAWAYADRAWEPVAAALELALEHGAAPAEGVRSAGDRLRASERSRLEAAAGRAATLLALPLGLLFLPAFTFTTVLPIAVALAPRSLG